MSTGIEATALEGTSSLGPAKWYFALKQARLESQRTGQPLRHPMAGPVTLRWRS